MYRSYSPATAEPATLSTATNQMMADNMSSSVGQRCDAQNQSEARRSVLITHPKVGAESTRYEDEI